MTFPIFVRVILYQIHWRLQLAWRTMHYTKWLLTSIVDYLLLPYHVSRRERCEMAPLDS